jgi:hypothetical protein
LLDALAELRLALGPFLAMREALGETMRAGDRDGHAQFLDQRPVLGIDQLHRRQAERRAVPHQFLGRHGIETPGHDRLPDASILHAKEPGGGGDGGDERFLRFDRQALRAGREAEGGNGGGLDGGAAGLGGHEGNI